MNETNIETSSVWPTICQSLLFLNFSLGLCATIMNGFVAQTLIVKHGIVSSADYFVLGLSFSDFITGVGLVFSLANILEIDHLGRTWCLFQVCLLQSSLLCSSFFMSMVTIDRYVWIVFPFVHERWCTECLPPLLCFIMFAVAFTIGLLPLTGSGSIDTGNYQICIYIEVIRREVVYFIYALIILPVIIIVILYLQIFKVAKQHIHIIAMARGKQGHIPRNRYIKMLFLMAGLYFIFYIPAAVIVPAVDFNWGNLATMNDVKRRSILHMSALLLLCNSIANPIIYAFKIDTVKDRVKRILGYPMANMQGLSDTLHSKSKQKQFQRYTSKVSIEAPLSFLPDHDGNKLSFTLAEIPEGLSIKETRKALYQARRKAIKESKKLNIVYSSQLNQEFIVKAWVMPVDPVCAYSLRKPC